MATERTLVALVGATATGKTALGEGVAERLGGEVVCADARQVFRELEVGSGKPTPAERAARPHRLFDWLTLDDRPTAGAWARAAAAACEACFARGVTPVLVGGSGLYVAALQKGLHPEPPRDATLRAELERDWDAEGAERMHARLGAVDPATAAALRPRDRQRVLRALEVVRAGGHPLAWWRNEARRAPVAATWRTFEITCPVAELAKRIAQRARTMWAGGLLDETRAIAASGKRAELRRLAAIGYDEALDFLEGAATEEEAIARMDARTRQLAKRQRTWFRHQQQAVRVDGSGAAPTDETARFLADSVRG